ncbi:MAG: ABC transporter ATP-binding protein [Desulfobacteraceae bacterium]|nr:MAG: ABC transporter ATP-binding protein [Desulfobacteraceae bacterium]
MIHLKRVDVFYGKSQALYEIELSVSPGEIVALIGANGAGKTTVLKAISGLIPWGGDDISFQNRSLRGMKAAQIAMLGISHVPERGGIFGKMTVIENLELGAAANRHGNERKQRFQKVFDLFPILRARSSQLGSLLSGGERQMLAIGRAMMSDPQLYLLDEPTLGMSPLMVLQIASNIEEISNQGGTILLVEQNARMALKISGRGYVLEIGRILREGPGQVLLQDEQVKKAYLGL